MRFGIVCEFRDLPSSFGELICQMVRSFTREAYVGFAEAHTQLLQASPSWVELMVLR